MNDNFTQLVQSSTQRGQTTGNAQDLRAARRLLLISTVITLALWFVPYANILLYPLRLFVTFIHESGHALAALITGGQVASLAISPNGEGVTWTSNSPLWGWLVMSGGYLGTALFGAILLVIGRLQGWRNGGRVTLYVIAATLLTITALWGWHSPFTLVTGLILSTALWALARYTSPQGAQFVASFLAVQCSLNALSDLNILLHLTTNTNRDNDTVFMSRAYFLPPTFWALLWAGMALVILFLALRGYWRAPAKKSL